MRSLGPVFSEPDDCANLVQFLQRTGIIVVFDAAKMSTSTSDAFDK